jgi:hypothetical protein
MAVAFDTTVSVNSATKPATMTAAPTAGTVGLLFVNVATDGGATAATSATYDGSAMTQVGSQINSSILFSRYYTHLTVFKIDSTPSGSKTISITSAGTVTAVRGTFISYTGVSSVGSLQTTSGSSASMSHATTSATDNIIAQAFVGALATSITSYNKTTRQLYSSNGYVVGDSVGASTVTFTATQNSSLYYSAAVDLTAATGSTTTLTVSGATIAVTGTAPSLVTTTVLTPAAATVTVTGTAPKLENTVSPPGGSLTGALITITGTAPTLTMSLVTTGATITITGGTPSSAGEAILTPAAATVTVTGTAPTLLLSVVPVSGTLPVTGGTPVLIAVTVLSPAAAPISVTGGTPVVILPITLQPSSASITVTGLNPTITVGIVIPPTPDEDHLLLVRREKRILSLEGSRVHTMGRFKQVVDA